MSKLIILQGPPCSGKSTWAKEYITHAHNTVIVSRDSFRLHLCGGETTNMFKNMNNAREELITKMESESITEALKAGFNVVVDATNLNPKTINRMYKLADGAGLSKTDIEFKEFYVPFKEAVERDLARKEAGGHYVGKHVIQRFYERYYAEKYAAESLKTVQPFRVPQQPDLPKAVICDLDGTVAWMQNRSPYDGTKVDADKCDPMLQTLLHAISMSSLHCIEVIFVSGREGTAECQEKTLNWLQKHFSFDFTILMRKEKDYRPDEVVKKEIYEQYIKDQYDVMCVFDDRQKVVDMWREQGLLCCQVAKGDF